MSGLSIAELCASVEARRAGVDAKRMLAFVADFEAAGIAERVNGDQWRLTPNAVAEYALPFRAIRVGNVPLEPGDDDGLNHCSSGPARAAERVAA